MSLPVRIPTCQECGDVEAAGPNAKYCRPCRRTRYRSKRAKWLWTRQKLQILRLRYDGAVKGRADDLSQQPGIPSWAVKRMAAKMGLTRPKAKSRREWSHEETQYLLRAIGRVGVDRMAANLGRSVVSVVLKMKRMRVSRVRDSDGVHTARDLAALMGVDSHMITGWIEKGALPAGKIASGGSKKLKYSIEEDDIVRFLIRHPRLWWIQSVDQDWFLWLFGKYVEAAPKTVRCHACAKPVSVASASVKCAVAERTERGVPRKWGEKYYLCPQCATLLSRLRGEVDLLGKDVG